MSRFELSGWVGLGGGELPGEALPDAHSSHTAPLILQLETGDFHPEEYISFGYTNFEAWCIGASGGYGGNETSGIHFDTTVVMVKLSNSDWSLHQELTRLVDRETSGEWDHLYLGGPPWPKNMMTAVELAEFYNPKHEIQVTTFSNPTVGGNPSAYGGGGGGGGLQVVGGLLVDLPQPTPVVVGLVGAQGAAGQSNKAPGDPYTPIPLEMTLGRFVTVTNRREELSNYFHDKQYLYPLPHPSFSTGPQPGEDGGASSFGDVCHASGGKGGGEAIYWPGGVKKPYGPGGQGGLGNQVEAGGGGAGDLVTGFGSGGSDGILDSVLLIGGGGGGGRGSSPGSYILTNLGWGPTWQLSGNRAPSKGGKGSYSYADTSVYGPGEPNFGDPGGGGGGAHRSGLKFGSYASAYGYSPNGAVILRVFKSTSG